MQKKFPLSLPSLSSELLQMILKSLASFDLIYSYLKMKENKLSLFISLLPESSENLISLIYDNYVKFKQNEVISCFNTVLEQQKKGIFQDNQNERLYDMEQFAEGKKLLFQRSQCFYDFIKKAPTKHIQLISEQIFEIISFQKIEREIDENEFLIISKLVNGKNKKLQNKKCLLIYEVSRKTLFLYYLKENESDCNKFKQRLETQYFFTIPQQNLVDPNEMPSGINQRKSETLMHRINYFLKKRDMNENCSPIKHEETYLAIKPLDKEYLDELKLLIEEKSHENLYYFSILTDVKFEATSELTNNLMQTFEENNLDIFVYSNEEVENSKKNLISSIDFLGNKADIYSFFKAKPKYLFLSSKFCLFCERFQGIEKIMSKILYEYKERLKLNQDKSDSLFIDLSMMTCGDRFGCVKSILNSYEKGDRSSSLGDSTHYSTPKKKNNPENDISMVPNGFTTSTSEKYTKNEQSLKSFRGGYDSEKKHMGKNLFTASEEEKQELNDSQETINFKHKAKDLNNNFTSYQFNHEKKVSQGDNQQQKIIDLENQETYTFSRQKPEKINIAKLKKSDDSQNDEKKLIQQAGTNYVKIYTNANLQRSLD